MLSQEGVAPLQLGAAHALGGGAEAQQPAAQRSSVGSASNNLTLHLGVRGGQCADVLQLRELGALLLRAL